MKKNNAILAVMAAACLSFAGCEGVDKDEKEKDGQPNELGVVSDELKGAIDRLATDLVRRESISDSDITVFEYKDPKNYTRTLYMLPGNTVAQKEVVTDDGSTKITEVYGSFRNDGNIYLMFRTSTNYTTDSKGNIKETSMTVDSFNDSGVATGTSNYEYEYEGDRLVKAILNGVIAQTIEYADDYNYTDTYYSGGIAYSWYEHSGNAKRDDIEWYQLNQSGDKELYYKSSTTYADSERERMVEFDEYDVVNGKTTLVNRTLYTYDSEGELAKEVYKSNIYGNGTTMYLAYKGFNIKTVDLDESGNVNYSTDSEYDPEEKCIVSSTTGDFDYTEKYYLR